MKWYGPPIQHQGNFSGDKNHLVFLRIQTGWTECVELMCQLNSSFFVCSIAKSCPTLCYPMDCSMPGFLVLHHLPELAQTHVHWVGDCHPTISSSVTLFFSCPQFFPASGFFPMSQLFASGGQSIEASASVLPMNIQGWFPLGLTALISLQYKGFSRIFSSTTVQKHQFFSAQPSFWSNFHIRTWLLEKTVALTIWTFVSKVMSLLFNMLSRFAIAFLPRSKCLLIMCQLNSL